MPGTYFFEGRNLDPSFVTVFSLFPSNLVCWHVLSLSLSLSLSLFLSSPFGVAVEHLEYCYWVIDWGLAKFLPSTFLKSVLPTHLQFWAYLSVSFLYLWCFQCFSLWLCLVEKIFIDSPTILLFCASFFVGQKNWFLISTKHLDSIAHDP